MTDGEPEASLQKIKLIKNQHNIYLFFIFYFIKSQTSDSFVNHFDGHFAYLKTLDFSFKHHVYLYNVYLARHFASVLVTQCVKTGSRGRRSSADHVTDHKHLAALYTLQHPAGRGYAWWSAARVSGPCTKVHNSKDAILTKSYLHR